MSSNNQNKPKALSARRLVLLASVAGVGAALLLGGPGGYSTVTLPSWTASAAAADSTSQHPAGFADLVARVKPAVISVRVKITPDETTGSGGGNVVPFKNDVPMQKFFQQFGFGNLPNGARPHQVIMGEGSGFFISADG